MLFPVVMLLPVLFFCWHPIEQSIRENVDNRLGNAHKWAQARTYNKGRDVLVAGYAPNQIKANAAVTLALQAKGVRTVSFVGTLLDSLPIEPKLELTPAKLIAAFTNNTLVLSGSVGSTLESDQLVIQASKHAGATRVINNLTIDSTIAPSAHFAQTLVVLASLSGEGILRLQDNVVTLSGSVTSRESKAKLSKMASESFEGDIDNQLTVVPPQCQITINTLLTTTKINFKSGSATINENSSELLERIGEATKNCREATFEVSGHTDSTGSNVLNNTLSLERAVSVVNYLASIGVKADRFTTRGAGSSEPKASNDSEEGKATNRRIEFRVNN